MNTRTGSGCVLQGFEFRQRIQYIHNYLVERLWYLAQIYPPPNTPTHPSTPDECVRQLNTSISWYVWRGEIFRVPLSTLKGEKLKEDGTLYT